MRGLGSSLGVRGFPLVLLLMGCGHKESTLAPAPSAGVAATAAAAPSASVAPQREDPDRSRATRGTLVVLSRPKSAGIPLHETAEGGSRFTRVASGTSAELLTKDERSGMFLVQLVGGARGYVSPRYVSDPELETSVAAAPARAARSISECRAEYEKRVRAAKGPLKVGTFNVRWFPDGAPGEHSKKKTDVAWLSCTLALMDAEVVALQEWKKTDEARKASKALLAELSRLTHDEWALELDGCPDKGAQHVGLLWNKSRVTVGGLETVGEFNPHGETCAGRLRPGLKGIVERPGEPPLTIMSVHFKSGVDSRSYSLREETWRRTLSLLEKRDGPVIVAGDFNTMGCEECAEKVSSVEERLARDAALVRASGELLPDAPACSHFYSGKPGLLDGFLVLGARAVRTTAFGDCALGACRLAPQRSSFEAAVSDHCPLTLELAAD